MLRCVLGTNLMPDTKLNFQKLHSSLVYYFSMPFRNTLECMMSFYINVRELLSIFIPLSLEKFSKFFINNISVKNYVTHSLWKCIFVFQNKNIKWINNNNDYFLLALKKNVCIDPVRESGGRRQQHLHLDLCRVLLVGPHDPHLRRNQNICVMCTRFLMR